MKNRRVIFEDKSQNSAVRIGEILVGKSEPGVITSLV